MDFGASIRKLTLGAIAVSSFLAAGGGTLANAQATAGAKKPNILVIFGDDIGYCNISAYNLGMMGYKTPNIDRIAHEGALFTDYYAQQSCTAGRAAFITGQSPIRTGLLKVGLPGSTARTAERRSDDRRTAEAARLHDLPEWQEPSWAIATSSCLPCTASMSFSATSIT